MVNKLYLIVVICCFNLAAKAQSATTYSDNLKNLYAIIQKLPSYKSQIKGEQEVSFTKLYNHLLIEKPANEFDHYYKLSQLMIPLRDNHLFFSQVPPVKLENKQFADSAFVKQDRESAAFKSFPKVEVNLAMLEKKLASKPKDGVEGIYFYNGDEMKMGLYRTVRKDSLVGVILSTKHPNWQTGQVAMVLKEFEPNRFRAHFARIYQKTFGLLRNEKFMHGMLTETRWKKDPKAVDHVNIGSNILTFQFKTIDKHIRYMRLGSFSSTEANLQISQKFFDTIKDSLTTRNLIVDLRNNGGGGYKSSDKFMKLLRQYASDGGHIYVLINNRTFSNAEQFAVRIKKSDNVTMLGETTNGTLAYGNNEGTVETLPGNRFSLYITDMPDSGHYLQFEDVGFPPDIKLDPAKDWIKQTVQVIKSRQQ
jgi:hypothetical protein